MVARRRDFLDLNSGRMTGWRIEGLIRRADLNGKICDQTKDVKPSPKFDDTTSSEELEQLRVPLRVRETGERVRVRVANVHRVGKDLASEGGAKVVDAGVAV